MRAQALAVCLALVTLAGCATPYQEMGFLGGVRAVRIAEDTIQVRAQGNAYTDEDTIQRFALRKAAEETIADGYDLFLIGTDTNRTRVGSETFGSAYGNRYGAWGSAFTMPVIKPGETLLVKMLKGPKPDPMPPGMFDAREVEKYLVAADGSREHRPCAKQPDGAVKCD